MSTATSITKYHVTGVHKGSTQWQHQVKYTIKSKLHTNITH